MHALNEVDLEIAEKEVVVLLGPSGSGKTTLLNIMGGLDRPTSGRLFFRDLDLTDLEDRELTKYRRDHVGFVSSSIIWCRASPPTKTWRW